MLLTLTGVMFLGTKYGLKYAYSYKLLKETDATCCSNLALDFTILHCYITADHNGRHDLNEYCSCRS